MIQVTTPMNMVVLLWRPTDHIHKESIFMYRKTDLQCSRILSFELECNPKKVSGVTLNFLNRRVKMKRGMGAVHHSSSCVILRCKRMKDLYS